MQRYTISDVESDSSDELQDGECLKRDLTTEEDYDDASTCGSDAMCDEDANAGMEEDPDEYGDEEAWGFLHSADQALNFAFVARDVPKSEMNVSTKALVAKDKEWSKLWVQEVWGETVVKGWGAVVWEAQMANK